MSSWERIENCISEQRQALLNHEVYSKINDVRSVQIFMESHVFAVWDFMSLLKILQREICCTSIPWTPPGEPALARLINEIVLAEETDINPKGRPASHFDLYHSAMKQVGARTQPVDQFLDAIRAGGSLTSAMDQIQIPVGAQNFVRQTFSVIDSGHIPSIAAAFTFGREDLLPDVFTKIITGIQDSSSTDLSEFIYYLDRHVALDGDEHGPMARTLVTQLCGDSEENWQLAEQAVVESLQARLDLWDTMNRQITEQAQKV